MKTELEKAIEELELQESPAEEVKETPEPEPQPESEVESEEPKPEPEPEPEPQPEVKQEQPLSQAEHAAIARANYEAREAKRKAAELQAEIERLKNPPKELPHPDDDLAGYTSGKLETLEQEIARLKQEREQEVRLREQQNMLEAAKNEFSEMENQFKATAPDYEEARTFIVQNIARSIKLLNPTATTQDLVKGVEHALLSRGSNAVNLGMNPAQAIYQEALQLGYNKPQAEKPKTSNLSAVAANRQKSAGMAAASKSGAGQLTMDDIANMTNEQRQKLTKEQWDSAV